MGGGGDESSTTTVQKADPWSGVQPYLLDIFEKAKGQYYSNTPQYYPGATTANFTPQELAAQQGVASYAQGGAQTLANQGLGAQSFLLGDVLQANSNPYMADYAKAAISPVWESLTRQGLPNVESGAVASGQYGGSRQGLAEGLAISDATQKSLDTTSKMYGDMYNTNLGAMQKAVALNPSVMQSGMLPSQMLAGVGEQQRTMQQAMIDDAVAKWEWEQALPSTKLAQYLSMVSGQYGGQSQSTTEGDLGGVSPVGKAAGAAATGLGAYGALTSEAMLGAGSIAAPWLAGAIALATLFS
jgi:hypothetical protein